MGSRRKSNTEKSRKENRYANKIRRKARKATAFECVNRQVTLRTLTVIKAISLVQKPSVSNFFPTLPANSRRLTQINKEFQKLRPICSYSVSLSQKIK